MSVEKIVVYPVHAGRIPTLRSEVVLSGVVTPNMPPTNPVPPIVDPPPAPQGDPPPAPPPPPINVPPLPAQV